MKNKLSEKSLKEWSEIIGKPAFDDVFSPAQDRYGFGALEVGEIIQIDCAKYGAKPRDVSNAVSGYGGYYKKKFTRKTKGNFLYVMRIQ